MRRAKPGEAIALLETALSWRVDQCLEWPFAVSKDGGVPLVNIEKKCVSARAFICEATHVEPKPHAGEAQSTCGNKLCIAPSHLFWHVPTPDQRREKFARGFDKSPNSWKRSDATRAKDRAAAARRRRNSKGQMTS